MPIPNETRPKPPSPTILQRSSAEARKPGVQFFLTFVVSFSAIFFFTLPFAVALTAILTGFLFAAVTWAAVKVR